LACPKCGTVFQFSTAPAAPDRLASGLKKPATAVKKHMPTKVSPPSSKAAAPIRQPPAPPAVPPPAPPPASDVIPLSTPATQGEEGGASNLDFNAPSEMDGTRLRRANRRRRKRIAGWIAMLLAGILLPALAIWGGMWVRHFINSNLTDDEPTGADNPFNSRFVMPRKPWTRDKDIQRRFHVHIGMRESEHNDCMGLLFKDYKDRMPSDAELIDEAVRTLRAYFKGLEWELQTKDGQTRLAGHLAQMLQFQGDDSDHVTYNGECYMLAYRGYGYWFFTWAPLGELEKHGESIHADWAKLRSGFSLLDERKGWKEKPRESIVVSGKKAKYRLAYLKGLWTREASDDEEPQMDLLLRGQEPDPERKPLSAKDATVQVLVLPPLADLPAATAAALAYVKQREMKLYERTVFEPIRDKNGDIDRDAKIGTEAGHLSKFHIKNTEDLERYLAIAVVNRPDGVVVLLGDCLWERHDFWDQEFGALFKTFKVK
jgi:hypothetical protein